MSYIACVARVLKYIINFLALLMCKIEKKSAFEHFVCRLIGLGLDDGILGSDDISRFNERLREYPMTRYMKLLYFLCLADADGKMTKAPGSSLFELFDNFSARERGPVEEDIYDRRLNDGFFTLFRMEGKYLQLRTDALNSRIREVNGNVAPPIKEDITQSLRFLADRSSIFSSKKILEQDVTSLVELSHSLSKDTWPGCYYCNYKGGSISLALQEARVLDDELLQFRNKTFV